MTTSFTKKIALRQATKASLTLLLLAHREDYNRGRFGSYGRLYQLMTEHIIPNYICGLSIGGYSQELEELSQYAYPDPLPRGEGKQYCICGASINTSARLHTLVYHCPICAGKYLRVSNITRAGSTFADFLECFAAHIASELRRPPMQLPWEWQLHTSWIEQFLIEIVISENERKEKSDHV